MNYRISRIMIIAVGIGLALALSDAALAQSGGPVHNVGFPPPGGVTWSGTGLPGHTGGATWTYSGFNPSAYTDLYFGVDTNNLPEAGMDGSLSNLTWDSNQSDLNLGKLVFTGTSTVYAWNGASYAPNAVNERLTMLFFDASQSSYNASDYLSLVNASSVNGVLANPANNTIGGVLQISRPSPLAGFKLNFLFEAQFQNASSWSPQDVLFNSLQTPPSPPNPPQSGESFSGAFYANAPVPELGSLTGLGTLLGLGGLSSILMLRTRRRDLA